MEARKISLGEERLGGETGCPDTKHLANVDIEDRRGKPLKFRAMVIANLVKAIVEARGWQTGLMMNWISVMNNITENPVESSKQLLAQ